MKLGSWTGVAFSFNTGTFFPNAVVEVRRESDGGLAAIFSDAAGLVPIAQPGFQADAQGMIHFYTAGSPDGLQVKVTMSAEVRTLRNQPAGNAAQIDVTDYSLQLLGASDVAIARRVLLMDIHLNAILGALT